MTNMPDAADQVAMLLRQLETELDQAFATGGRLAAALPQARTEARLSAVVGHQAYEHFSNAIVAIGAARGHAVAGHRILDVLAAKLGYETAFGDVQPKPAFTGADAAHLRVAA